MKTLVRWAKNPLTPEQKRQLRELRDAIRLQNEAKEKRVVEHSGHVTAESLSDITDYDL